MWVIILLKKTISLFIFLSILFISVTAYAQTGKISAYSAVSIDGKTNTVLYEKNAYTKLPVASTTKIMTSIIACESGDLERVITVTADMLRNTEGTLIYLKAGDRISLLDLIKGALISSGNDAANVIAFALAGGLSEFSCLMNAKAKALGMNNTHFVTPSGLDSIGHYSCAYDMALLSSYAMKNEIFRDIVKSKTDVIFVNGNKQTLYNHNKLLKRDNSFIGIKTGFTKKAGRCLVSCYNYDGADIICVTLNAPDDWDDHLKLVNKAKKKYSLREAQGGVIIPSADGNDVRCSYSYSVNTLSDTYIRLYYYPFIYSPYKSGDIAGKAEIYVNNTLIDTCDIKII